MKSIRNMAKKAYLMGVVLLLLVLAAGISGCGKDKLYVIPWPNRNVLALDSGDIIEVMSKAGFNDEQILKFGTDIRNALLNSGAAHVRMGNKVEVIFAIQADFVYVTTRLRGTFIYHVDKGWMLGGQDRQPTVEADGNKGRGLLLTPSAAL